MIRKLTGGLDIKRLYLEGLILKFKCPKCGEEVAWDGSLNCLSYPTLEELESIYLYCDNCDYEFSKGITLHLTIETK